METNHLESVNQGVQLQSVVLSPSMERFLISVLSMMVLNEERKSVNSIMTCVFIMQDLEGQVDDPLYM